MDKKLRSSPILSLTLIWSIALPLCAIIVFATLYAFNGIFPNFLTSLWHYLVLLPAPILSGFLIGATIKHSLGLFDLSVDRSSSLVLFLGWITAICGAALLSILLFSLLAD